MLKKKKRRKEVFVTVLFAASVGLGALEAVEARALR
jgi:hypothetical protein